MIIRLAKIEELEALNELIRLSARELSKSDYSKEEIDAANKYVFGVDTALIEDKTYFVIEKDGIIAGCGGWSKRKTLFGGNQFASRNDGTYLDPIKDAAKIRAFFIHPLFARQGLGGALLKHCEHEAQLAGFFRLEMMATLPGVKLYRAMGYQSVANEVVPLPNNIALRFVRMSKNLQEIQYTIQAQFFHQNNEDKNNSIEPKYRAKL